MFISRTEKESVIGIKIDHKYNERGFRLFIEMHSDGVARSIFFEKLEVCLDIKMIPISVSDIIFDENLKHILENFIERNPIEEKKEELFHDKENFIAYLEIWNFIKEITC